MPSWPALDSALPIGTVHHPVNLFSRIGIVFLIPFLYFLFSRILDVTVPHLHLPLVFGVITMIATVLEGSLLQVLQSPTARYLTLYSFWFGVTAVTGLWKGGSFWLLRDYWIKSFIIFLALACLVASLQRVRWALRAMTLAIASTAVVALLIGDLDREGRLRLPAGELANSNAFGIIMVLGLTLCWYGATHPVRRKFWRIATVASAVPIIYAAARTGSRAAFVAFLLTLLYVFFRLPLPKKIWLVLLCIPLLGGLAALIPEHLQDRLATVFVTDTEEAEGDPLSEVERSALASRRSRWQLLQRSIIITLQNPILGVGPGNFMVAEDELAKQEKLPRGSWRATHNAYTETSSEMGLPGLILYCTAMVSAWAAMRRLSRLNASDPQAAEIQHTAFSLQAALFCISVAAFFGLSLYTYYIPSLLGLITGFARWAHSTLAACPQPSPSQTGPQEETRASSPGTHAGNLRRPWPHG